MLNKFLKAAAVAATVAVSTAGHASVIGETASVSFYYPNSSSLYCSNGTAVIGAGVEYPIGCSGFHPVGIDIGNGTVTVTHSNTGGFAPGSFNGFSLDILGIDLGSVSYIGGSLGVTAASIIGGNAWFNFASQGDGTANFTFTEAGGNNVPEPLSLILFATAFLATGAARRRQA